MTFCRRHQRSKVFATSVKRFLFDIDFSILGHYLYLSAGPHEFQRALGRTAGFLKPVGRSGKWRSLIGLSGDLATYRDDRNLKLGTI